MNLVGSDLKASVSTANSRTQGKIDLLESKLHTLDKAISKITKENEALSSAMKNSKRAGTVLGLEKEMERQDLVIEILRDRIGIDKGDRFVEMKPTPELADQGFSKLSIIDRELINELNKGPKRIRPPTREELYIQLRGVFSEYKDIEDKYFKLFPGRNADKYRSKGVQTEVDPLAVETKVDMNAIDNEISKAEGDTKIKLEKLKQNLKIQTEAIAKLKQLIQSRSNNTKKLRSLQEDYEDLVSEVAQKKSSISAFKAQNDELSQKIDTLVKAKSVGIEALREQEQQLRDKVAQVRSENNKLDTGVNGILAQLGSLANSDAIETLLAKIKAASQVSREHEQTIDKLKNVQKEKESEKAKVEVLVSKVQKEVEAIRDGLKDEVLGAADGVKQQNELEHDVDWEIDQLKKRIRNERNKEVQELAQLEDMELQLKQLQDKNSALVIAAKYLGGTGASYFGIDTDNQEHIKAQFRLEFESKLNQKILGNTQLAKKVQEAEDYLYLLSDSPVVDAANDTSMNSKIESIRTFKVFQPEERLAPPPQLAKPRRPAN